MMQKQWSSSSANPYPHFRPNSVRALLLSSITPPWSRSCSSQGPDLNQVKACFPPAAPQFQVSTVPTSSMQNPTPNFLRPSALCKRNCGKCDTPTSGWLYCTAWRNDPPCLDWLNSDGDARRSGIWGKFVLGLRMRIWAGVSDRRRVGVETFTGTGPCHEICERNRSLVRRVGLRVSL